jgi:hypothetical protein
VDGEFPTWHSGVSLGCAPCFVVRLTIGGADCHAAAVKFQPVTDSFDYVKHDVMIPMRDRVKLHAVILVPKGAKNAPILLTRTPYNVNDLTGLVTSFGRAALSRTPGIWKWPPREVDGYVHLRYHSGNLGAERSQVGVMISIIRGLRRFPTHPGVPICCDYEQYDRRKAFCVQGLSILPTIEPPFLEVGSPGPAHPSAGFLFANFSLPRRLTREPVDRRFSFAYDYHKSYFLTIFLIPTRTIMYWTAMDWRIYLTRTNHKRSLRVAAAVGKRLQPNENYRPDSSHTSGSSLRGQWTASLQSAN